MTVLWMYLLEVPEYIVFACKHHLAAHCWTRPCGLVDLSMGVRVVRLIVLVCVEYQSTTFEATLE